MIKLMEEKDIQGMRKLYDAILYQPMEKYPEEGKVKLLNGVFQQTCYK